MLSRARFSKTMKILFYLLYEKFLKDTQELGETVEDLEQIFEFPT